MKKCIVLVALLLLLLLSSAYALEGKYMYVSLSYGQGWWPWVCTTENGMKGVWGKDYKCDQNNARGCPFEQDKMYGQLLCVAPGFIGTCGGSPKSCTEDADNKYQTLLPPSYGFLTRINIPADFKLATADGNVVGDEVCVGDKLQLTKGADKGEAYGDGGNDDSPPVYWVSDVEALVKNIMAYHEATKRTWKDICAKKAPSDGFVDPLSGVPVYTTSVQMMETGAAYVTGNMVCSLKGESGSGFSSSGSYTATTPGTVDLAATYAIECMYYYYGGVTASGVSDLGYWSDFSEGSCPYMVLKVPTVLQDGPSASPMSYNDHPYAASASDFFKVGTVGIKKTIKVSAPSNGAATITIPGGENVTLSQQNNVRVLVKNTGNTDLLIKKVYGTSGGKLISCDSTTVKPGDQAECILQVVPEQADFKVSVDYEYTSCGRTKSGVATKSVFSSTKADLSASVQVHSMDVEGACKNAYYACESPDKNGKLVAGYACYDTGNGFYAAANERFDLKFSLPDLSGKTLVSARLNMVSSKVNKIQEVSVYSTGTTWAPVSCTAGGDICTQPYCAECRPVYDLLGGIEDKAQIGNDGKYSFDVIGLVNSAYSGTDKTVSLQVRGVEDLWNTEGASSCGKLVDWARQDVEFYGMGPSQPYLEMVYK